MHAFCGCVFPKELSIIIMGVVMSLTGCGFYCTHTCREIGGECSHQGDFLVFEGNHYRNGFMYKSFGMSAIIHEGVKPTLQELEKFEATPEEVEIEGRGEWGEGVPGLR